MGRWTAALLDCVRSGSPGGDCPPTYPSGSVENFLVHRHTDITDIIPHENANGTIETSCEEEKCRCSKPTQTDTFPQSSEQKEKCRLVSVGGTDSFRKCNTLGNIDFASEEGKVSVMSVDLGEEKIAGREIRERIFYHPERCFGGEFHPIVLDFLRQWIDPGSLLEVEFEIKVRYADASAKKVPNV